MKKAVIYFFLIFATSINTNAQSTFEFLNLDLSPRAAATGGTFVANNDDPNVIFYNPAGIKLLEESLVSFSYLNHLVDINSAGLASSSEIEGFGRFGLGINYTNYGTFTGADEFRNLTGEFSANEFALIVGYANNLDKNFYYGVNTKFIFSNIAERTSTGIGFDLGLHYAIPESKWNFGFSVLNLGTQLSSYFKTKEDLPLDIRVGVSKELEHLPFRFYFSLNGLNENPDDFGSRFKQFSIGGEFRMSEVIRLRFGYDNERRKELKIGTTAGLAGYHLGLGFKVNKYNVDYSFSSLGSIGSLHRFGVTTSF